VHFAHGQMLLLTGGPQGTAAATEAFQKALDYNHPSVVARVNHAAAKYRSGDQSAGELFTQIVKDFPNSVMPLLFQGQLLLERNEIELAKEVFQKAIKVEPENPMSYVNLGMVAHGQELYDEAIEHFESALRADPRCELANSQLGQIYLQQKEFEKAIEYYNEVIKIVNNPQQLTLACSYRAAAKAQLAVAARKRLESA